MSPSINFVVDGRPVSQGSMTLQPNGRVWHTKKGRGETVLGWRSRAQWYGKRAMLFAGVDKPMSGAVDVNLRAYFTMPKTTKDPEHASTELDLDKICRAAGDALSGVVIQDDRQICGWYATKAWGSPERVELVVTPRVGRQGGLEI